MKKNQLKRVAAFSMAVMFGMVSLGMTGCGSKKASGEGKVVIYSNADDEAVKAMKNALDKNGYKDQYLFRTFGTSELGGKLLAEDVYKRQIVDFS